MALSEEFAQDGVEAYELGRIEVSLQRDVSVITLVGEVDLAMRETLDAACREVLDRDLPVRIDASALSFIDSSGLAFITRLVQVGSGGRPAEVSGASPLIVDTIRIVGLADLVDLT
jgi:anti-sigma B factor antagonist